jgi:hypothetical protein
MTDDHPPFLIDDSGIQDLILGYLDAMQPCAPDPHMGGTLFELSITRDGSVEQYNLLSATSEAGDTYVTVREQWYITDHALWNTVVEYYPKFDGENHPPAYHLSINYMTTMGPRGRGVANYDDPELVWSKEEQDFSTGILGYLDGMAESSAKAQNDEESINIIVSKQDEEFDREYVCYKETDARGYQIVQYLGERRLNRDTTPPIVEHTGGGWFVADKGFYTYLMSYMGPEQGPEPVEADLAAVDTELSTDTISLGQIGDSFTVPYTLRNYSPVDVYTGQEYSIVQFDGEAWSATPFDFAEREWQDMQYVIPSGGTLDLSMFLWDFEEAFAPGVYRLAQKVYLESGAEHTLYSLFTVTE